MSSLDPMKPTFAVAVKTFPFWAGRSRPLMLPPWVVHLPEISTVTVFTAPGGTGSRTDPVAVVGGGVIGRGRIVSGGRIIGRRRIVGGGRIIRRGRIVSRGCIVRRGCIVGWRRIIRRGRCIIIRGRAGRIRQLFLDVVPEGTQGAHD